jgi:dienelactone hydrolase
LEIRNSAILQFSVGSVTFATVGRPRAALVTIVSLVCLATALFLRPTVHGLSFVIRAADLQGAPRSIADLDAGGISESSVDMELPAAGGSTRMSGRLYQPKGLPRRYVLLTSGLHPDGVAEPRLVGLARQLAATGVAVMTPDIPALSRFEITPALTDAIEAAAVWLSGRSSAPRATASDGRIGLMGISFSGGLSVVAAGRPSLKDHVAWVLSVGGHDDLPRVLRYLCTGIEPLPRGQLGIGLKDASAPAAVFARPPHDYALAVVLLGVADRLVPQSQVDLLRNAVRKFLVASTEERVDRRRAEQGFADLHDVARTLPEPAASFVRTLNDRDVVHLGSRLLPHVGAYGSAPALSPSRSPAPSAPVFVLHGSDDPVIPTIEAEYLAGTLRGRVPVRLLVTDLISHADAGGPRKIGALLELASFWGAMLFG